MNNNPLSCKIDLIGDLSAPEFQVRIYRPGQLSGPERKATFDQFDDALEWISRVMPEEAGKLLETNLDDEPLPNLPHIITKGPNGIDHPIYFIRDDSDLKYVLKLREKYFKKFQES